MKVGQRVEFEFVEYVEPTGGKIARYALGKYLRDIS